MKNIASGLRPGRTVSAEWDCKKLDITKDWLWAGLLPPRTTDLSFQHQFKGEQHNSQNFQCFALPWQTPNPTQFSWACELHSCLLSYRDPPKLLLLFLPITTLCKSMRNFRSLPYSYLPTQDTKHPLTWESCLTPPKHALYCSWQLLFTASYFSFRAQDSLDSLKDCE